MKSLILSSITGYVDTSFLATFDVLQLNITSNPIVFPVAVMNDGGNYDVTSGIYTVPVDGVYEFVFKLEVGECLPYRSIGVHLIVDDNNVSLI